MSYEWVRTGEMTPEEEWRYEESILLSGARALSMAFGGTPEAWRSEQQRIVDKRKAAKEPAQDTKWSVQ